MEGFFQGLTDILIKGHVVLPLHSPPELFDCSLELFVVNQLVFLVQRPDSLDNLEAIIKASVFIASKKSVQRH